MIARFSRRIGSLSSRGIRLSSRIRRTDRRISRGILPQATFTADAYTQDGRPMVSIGYVWVGGPDEGMAYLRTMRTIGQAKAESVQPMRYLELQSIGDANHVHGRRRYSAGHYLTELPDASTDDLLAAVDAASSLADQEPSPPRL